MARLSVHTGGTGGPEHGQEGHQTAAGRYGTPVPLSLADSPSVQAVRSEPGDGRQSAYAIHRDVDAGVAQEPHTEEEP